MVYAINAGVQRITEIRSDTLLNGSQAVITITPLTALSGSISIADKWKAALVQYVVWYFLTYHGKTAYSRVKAGDALANFERLVRQ